MVFNTLEYKKLSYKDLYEVGRRLEIPVKELVCTINSTQDFFTWYNEVTQEEYKLDGEYIEGFVIEDSKGFMCKTKGEYYNKWKFCRSIFNKTKKSGYMVKTSSLTTKFFNDFYNWCKENRETLPEDIISARKMFLEQYEESGK